MTDFEEIYATYFDSVYQYVLSLCRDVHAAEEVTQESFCKAMTHLDRFDAGAACMCGCVRSPKIPISPMSESRNAAPPRRRTSHPIRALRASCWTATAHGSCTDSCTT